MRQFFESDLAKDVMAIVTWSTFGVFILLLIYSALTGHI